MKAKQVLTYVISLGIGVVLFYGAFSFIDDKEALWETMRSARWEGIAASFVMGYLAIVSRGLRWGILLEPLGRQARQDPKRTRCGLCLLRQHICAAQR